MNQQQNNDSQPNTIYEYQIVFDDIQNIFSVHVAVQYCWGAAQCAVCT